MKTLLDFPAPRGPRDREQSMIVFWSRFDDVVGRWDLDGDETVAIARESMAALVESQS